MNDASLLITKRLVGDATPQEIAQLSGWINASPRNARQYAEEVYLFRSIRDKYAGETAVDSVCSLQTPRQAAYRLVADRPRFSAAAMVLLAAMLGLWAVSGDDADPAMVVDVLGTESIVVGPLTEGRHRFDEGVVSLAFASTAQVVLEGPCEFEVINEKLLKLYEGKALAYCPSEQAHGFTIKTPACSVTDLGTEFGVAVGPDGETKTVVLSGEVELSTDQATPVKLFAGDARHTMPGQSSQPMAMSAVPTFTSLSKLALLKRSETGGLPARWAGASSQLISDPSLELWLDMNPVGDGLALVNHAHSNGRYIHRADGQRHNQTDGRFVGDVALRFERPGDALRIEVPGEHDALTYAAWVRLDRVDTADLVHRGLVMSDGWGHRGQTHWQVKGDDFRLSFFDQGDEIDPRFAASPQGMVDGQWQLLTSVIDRQAKEVRHYLDGKLVDRRSVDVDLPPLTIGHATIGGWLSGREQTRVLEGTIDELLIWSRPLSDAEVQRLFEDSRMKTN